MTTDHQVALMERTSAGLTVTADYGEDADGAFGLITVRLDGRIDAFVVSPANLLDAFNHPCVYLDAERVAVLGVK